MGWIKSPSIEKEREMDKISPKNSIEENLKILKERLTEVKPWFDYKVTKERKFKLLYNNHELNLEIKKWESLLATAKMIKEILTEYKQKWFDKKKYRFYKEADLISPYDTVLKVDNNLLLPDITVWDGWEISKTLWSNLEIRSAQEFDSVKRKKDINTWKVADFLNSILDDYFKG